jgi:hypothetical protein
MVDTALDTPRAAMMTLFQCPGQVLFEGVTGSTNGARASHRPSTALL